MLSAKQLVYRAISNQIEPNDKIVRCKSLLHHSSKLEKMKSVNVAVMSSRLVK